MVEDVKPEVAIKYLEGLADSETWEARAISLRQVIATIERLQAEVERLRLAQMSAFYEGWDARSRARTFEVDTAWEYSSTKELLDEHGNR